MLIFSLTLTALITGGIFHLIWLKSVHLKDASIVDSYWGIGFGVIAWVSYALTLASHQTGAAHGYWLAILSSIWGVRLSGYLHWRNHGKGEDPRYAAMRAKSGPAFEQTSRYTVFYLQAGIQWLISLPLQWGQVSQGTFGLFAWSGFIAFVIGLVFETVGDWQLARFKADPANRGRVMDRGLWAWTRHPNYFGDSCVWWGLCLIAIDGTGAWWLIFSPIVMTFLITQVSGVRLLEQGLRQSKPDYDSYAARVSGFWPLPPKSS